MNSEDVGMACYSLLAMPLQFLRKSKVRKDRQTKEKLQLLRRDAAQKRKQAEQAQSLRLHTWGWSLGESQFWSSLLDSFLHAHEKHNAFTMMQLRALDQHDRVA